MRTIGVKSTLKARPARSRRRKARQSLVFCKTPRLG